MSICCFEKELKTCLANYPQAWWSSSDHVSRVFHVSVLLLMLEIRQSTHKAFAGYCIRISVIYMSVLYFVIVATWISISAQEASRWGRNSWSCHVAHWNTLRLIPIINVRSQGGDVILHVASLHPAVLLAADKMLGCNWLFSFLRGVAILPVTSTEYLHS